MILLTGATGFIGGRLLYALDRAGLPVRCLVRPGETLRRTLPLQREPEVVIADLLERESLAPALEGCEAAYYLVHSMGGRSIAETEAFVDRDRRCAENFQRAAAQAGIGRIVYLGGLGETGSGLSHHLASRQEVARILQGGEAKTTVLRAAVIIGAGGASFEIVRHLVERLPIMLCPRWVDTRCQPIAVNDVVAYLVGCLAAPETAGASFDIGGVEILTYRELMLMYAKVRRLRRWIVPVPVLTPRFSAYWVNLLTPVPRGIVFPLVEGLKNEVVCRENRIRELVPLVLTGMAEALCTALAETREGPGRLPSVQACFLRR